MALEPCPYGTPITPGNAEEYKAIQSGYFSKRIQGSNYGLFQQLSLYQLYSYACMCSGGISPQGCRTPWQFPNLVTMDWYKSRKTFCDELMYPNGKIVPESERPIACGGTKPDIYVYDPVNEVVQDLQEQNYFVKTVEATNDRSKQILAAGLVFIVVLVLLYLFVFKK